MELEGICLNPWVGWGPLGPKCDIPDFYREKSCMLANFPFVPACMLEPFSCTGSWNLNIHAWQGLLFITILLIFSPLLYVC